MNFTDAFISSLKVAGLNRRLMYMTHIAEKPATVKLTLGKLLAFSPYIYMLESEVIGLISLTKWCLFSEDFIKPLSPSKAR